MRILIARIFFHSLRISLICLTINRSFLLAQADSSKKFTRADTLRGMLTPPRSCYNVTYYDLQLAINLKKHLISGSNTIYFENVNDFDSLQVDLFPIMKIEKIVFAGQELKFRREFSAVFVKFPEKQLKGNNRSITIYFSGVPQVAKSPPWNGGFVWKKDPEGRDWVGVACEGTGASSWWPCKDHLSDKPDSMQMSFTVASGPMCVSNGNLRDTINNHDGTTTWRWFVSYPISNYNVTLNIAWYSHFHDTYISNNVHLDLDYYVLSDNLQTARQHFQQVETMLACFEKYFGPYPFPRDGYALVETNYWGMEHQSAIAYGNNYENNNYGFDFIIVHESAHEWWGNNVSCSDVADLWIHESFATYAEYLYLECTQGFDAALSYAKNQRWKIADNYPIIGPYNVNFQGTVHDNDMYNKGAWMLITFRNVLNNDSVFFSILKRIQGHFALKTINTNELITYISELAGNDYTAFFTQYLRFPTPPIFQFKAKQRGKDTKLEYRFKTDVKNFSMSIEVASFYEYHFGTGSKKFTRLNVTNEWQTIVLPDMPVREIDVNTDKFYVKKEEVK